MNKQAGIFGFIVLFCFISMTGCGQQLEKQLNIYNWTLYIPDQVLNDFEKKYKVQVITKYYVSNEDMYSNLKAAGKDYDVAFPSGDYVSIMIKDNMLEKLDKGRVPNFGLLDKEILKKIKFDEGNNYSVPFMMGATGIAVNRKFIKTYPYNYHIFEDSKLKGKMTLLDEPREVIGAALKTLGLSVNSTNENELKQAKELVLRWMKNIQMSDSESFGKDFAEGKYWVCQAYIENIFLEADEETRKNIDFFIPDTGGTMYIDSMVILKDSKHKNAAYAFLNYIHEPQVYAKILDFLSLPSINIEARKLVTKKPHYPPEALLNCELSEDIGLGIEKVDKIWKEIKEGK